MLERYDRGFRYSRSSGTMVREGGKKPGQKNSSLRPTFVTADFDIHVMEDHCINKKVPFLLSGLCTLETWELWSFKHVRHFCFLLSYLLNLFNVRGCFFFFVFQMKQHIVKYIWAHFFFFENIAIHYLQAYFSLYLYLLLILAIQTYYNVFWEQSSEYPNRVMPEACSVK